MRLIRRFAALFRKELLQLLKNKRMRIIVIVPPVILLMLLGYAAAMDLRECPFAVLDRARTAETRTIAAGFANSDVFVRRADFTDEAEMRRRTPYSRFEIMLAKGTSGMLIGIVQALRALTVTLHWFRVPFSGSPGALAVLLLSFLSSAVGIGLLVSVYCANLQQAMIFTIVIAAPLAMLSGMATPVACMPDVL